MVYFFSSLNFQHSISVIHHTSLITHYSLLITQNTLPVWHCHSVVITQYFSHYLWAPYLSHGAGIFFFHSVSPNPVKNKTEQQTQEKKGKKKKKSKVVKRCNWYCLWVLYVYLITILPLSDRNRVMETEWWWCQTTFLLWVLSFFLSYELGKLLNQTPSKSLTGVDSENWHGWMNKMLQRITLEF